MRSGVQAKVFKPLAEAGIVVDVIVQALSNEGHTNLTFTLPKGDLKRARDVLAKHCADLCPADQIEGRGEPVQGLDRRAPACARTPAWRPRCSRSWRRRTSAST